MLFAYISAGKQEKEKYNAMLGSLKINDEVMTKGGIIGKIINIREDENFITIQTGPDRIKIKLDKTGVLNVLSDDKDSKVLARVNKFKI